MRLWVADRNKHRRSRVPREVGPTRPMQHLNRLEMCRERLRAREYKYPRLYVPQRDKSQGENQLNGDTEMISRGERDTVVVIHLACDSGAFQMVSVLVS